MRGEVELAEVLFLDVVEEVAVDGVRRPLPLQLEDDHAGVVAGGEQVQRRVRRDDPEPVVLAPVREREMWLSCCLLYPENFEASLN